MGRRGPLTPFVSLADFRAAADLLRPVAVRTPLLPDDALSEKLGTPILVKPEVLQRGGAFKFRGAYTYVARLTPAQRAKGIITGSSGNHGQGVALAAKLFGIKATIVMPTTVPRAKRDGAERLGARCIYHGVTTAERIALANEIQQKEDLVFIPPFDDDTIITGQGTCGLEIAEDLPDVGTVLVPIGGGGLSAGVARAVKLLVPTARVIGVEPEGSPKFTKARAAGEPVTIPANPTGLADGLLAVRIGSRNFEYLEAHLDEVVTVPDGRLPCAMQYALERLKLVCEPSGAITLAALLDGTLRPQGKTVAVLSGGNIEYDGLRALLGDAMPGGTT
ncbi:threonine/serine dehydratase [Pseudogemmatithrix spongiicola]|uniref:Threonine/serine dehydratase n=1 Tax=Pseudogemmatithrix spongiicola TaxID=3062599 RepID=A0AA49Q6M8_9BACT|nr:threonine/serine dehydratase [Gemmatimonadaceae bacterium 'strain 138']WKW13946.1 threonine/serine dehydratase [Gemmatimonadaceae bacterium 'strain 318']